MAATATTEVAGLEVKAMLSGMLKELEAAGKLTRDETRAMASEWAKLANAAARAQKAQGKAASDAARQTTASTGNMKAGWMSLQQQLMDVGVMLQGGMSPVTILTTQGPQIATALQQMGGGMAVAETAAGALSTTVGVLAAGVGALGVAAVVGYGIWNVYAHEVDTARIAAERLTTTLDGVAPASRRVQDAQLEADKAAGVLTDSQYNYEKSIRAAKEARDKDIEAALKAKGVTMDQVKATQALMDGTGQYADGLRSMDQGLVQAAVTVNAINEGYAQQEKQLQRVKDGTDAKAAADERAKNAAKANAAEQKRLAEILKREEAEYAALNEAIEANYKAYDDAEGAITTLEAASKSATDSMLSDIGKVIQRRDDELARQKAVYEDGIAAAQNNADQKRRIEDAYFAAQIDTATAANQQLADMELERRKKAEDGQKQAMDSILSAAGELAGQFSDMTSDAYASLADNLATTQAYANQVDEYLTDSQKDALDERIANQKAAAIKAFEINKGVQIAAATIQGISAAVAAFNAGMQSAPGPFAPAVAAAFAAGSVAVTGAQIATIASETPAFHSGGLAPDERMARVLPGEGVISRQGMSTMGREPLDRVNAGISTGGGDIYAITAYRHTQQTTRYERDRLARNSPYMQEIAKGRTPGMRSL